jgi:hypothetical protein
LAGASNVARDAADGEVKCRAALKKTATIPPPNNPSAKQSQTPEEIFPARMGGL